MTVRGTVRGGAIWLEKVVPDLEGKVVEVHLEVVQGREDLSPEEQREAWDAWIDRGPHGSIEPDEPEGEAWPP